MRDLRIILKQTNTIWNRMRLNSMWSVGTVSKLINDKDFKSYQEWEDYYFESGRKRRELIEKLPKEEQVIVLNPSLDINTIKQLPEHLIDINYNYGRTPEEISNKAFALLGGVTLQGGQLGIDEAIAAVCQRVLVDVYDGIIKRERNTINTLSSLLPGLTFKEMVGIDDNKYGVDYEIYKQDQLICGLQIKPESYISNNNMSSHRINLKKNKQYYEDFGVEVLYVYSDKRGIIKNFEIIELISKMGDNIAI